MSKKINKIVSNINSDIQSGQYFDLESIIKVIESELKLNPSKVKEIEDKKIVNFIDNEFSVNLKKGEICNYDSQARFLGIQEIINKHGIVQVCYTDSIVTINLIAETEYVDSYGDSHNVSPLLKSIAIELPKQKYEQQMVVNDSDNSISKDSETTIDNKNINDDKFDIYNSNIVSNDDDFSMYEHSKEGENNTYSTNDGENSIHNDLNDGQKSIDIVLNDDKKSIDKELHFVSNDEEKTIYDNVNDSENTIDDSQNNSNDDNFIIYKKYIKEAIIKIFADRYFGSIPSNNLIDTITDKLHNIYVVTYLEYLFTETSINDEENEGIIVIKRILNTL